jgi:murein L,D-transpeptidase YafK
MFSKLARFGLLIAVLGVAGCTESSVKDFAPKYANRELPQKILAAMRAKDMDKKAPIMARIFKEENTVEIWKQKRNGRYDIIATYPICKWSGKLGPKYTEGDRQAPEGFYTVRPSQMNPRSSYHLSFNIGFPNAYDRVNGRTGANLMVHGACSSSGCYSMTDPQIEEIYAFGRDAFRGGQSEIQIEAFPFRMTAANMARYRNDPNYDFWKMLKVGYDNFEITKVPPKVDVCEKRYVFNQVAANGETFSPAGACPSTVQPDGLKTAYTQYQSKYEAAFNSAIGSGGNPAPKPTILGAKEAAIVADWSKRRARGERVPIAPPSLNSDGSVSETSRMGRIDSPLGRKMAAADAEKAAKRKAEEEKAAAVAAAEAAKEMEKQRVAEEKAARKAAATASISVPAETVTRTASEEGGMVSKMKKRLFGMFGG